MYWSTDKSRDMTKSWVYPCPVLNYFPNKYTLTSKNLNSSKSTHKINHKFKNQIASLKSKIMYEFLHKTQEIFQKNENDSCFVLSPKFYK